jgi:Ion channel
MARAPSPPGSAEATLPFLHLWRIVLLCAAITHEREHPALALLLLVPLNHFVYNLTATLETASRRATHWKKVTGVVPGQSLPPAWFKRAGLVAGLHLLASITLVWWYGSFDALSADLKAFGRTWELWALVATLILLDLLYRPLVRSLRRVVGATGLLDSRLWSALFLAIAVWIWCDGVFAALYQQLSLYCDGSAVSWCEGGQVFSQSLARFVDAAYFSTVTLSTTGYGDILPLAAVARALVAVEIIIGFGLLGFLLSRVAGFVSPTSDRDQAGESRNVKTDRGA